MEIKKLTRPNIRSLHPYEAEEIPCTVKLNANESPYGFYIPGSVRTNRYPDPEAKDLRRLIARMNRVKTENVMHGNGSDELIAYLIMVFGGPVLYPAPTFSMYGIIAQALGEIKVAVPLEQNFDIDMTRMKQALHRKRPKLTFLSSPNNPTGNCFSRDKILGILQQSNGLVAVDEAYQPFSEEKSYVPLIDRHKNLVILQTLSKIGLAALRTGFVIANPEIIEELNKVRLPFNVNSLSQNIAIDVLQKRTEIRKFIRSVISERKTLIKKMNRIKEIRTYPSQANFILFKVSDADSVFHSLLDQGVLVRNMKGVLDGCLRVTVGTPEENSLFLQALRKAF